MSIYYYCFTNVLQSPYISARVGVLIGNSRHSARDHKIIKYYKLNLFSRTPLVFRPWEEASSFPPPSFCTNRLFGGSSSLPNNELTGSPLFLLCFRAIFERVVKSKSLDLDLRFPFHYFTTRASPLGSLNSSESSASQCALNQPRLTGAWLALARICSGAWRSCATSPSSPHLGWRSLLVDPTFS
jgi:hypothetical protein